MAAPLPPHIQTYHCICTSLLLASTHTLSSLPRRQGSTLDTAIILPVPSSPPGQDLDQDHSLSRSASPERAEAEADDEDEDSRSAAQGLTKDGENDLPPQGYTILLSLTPDRKATVIRREDGFERRLLWRCGRCRLVVGYEIEGADSMDVDDQGKGKELEWKGKVLYLLPGGIMSTELMMNGRKEGNGKGIFGVGEEDVDICVGKGVGVFE
jgi:hypothetical protein